MGLIGTDGIGKTSIILTVLDDRRIKQRFGDNRWFIRCDQLTASHTHFLRKLSEVIGAGFENPEDLAPLRRYLSSKEMIMVLDNLESILGLPETAQEIHRIVDELSQFSNICLVITSQVHSVLPAPCKIIEIPTLSMEAGKETFYRIYENGERSDRINKILKELDFHPLSITLLATVAWQNGWNAKELTEEWEKQRTGVLRALGLGSLAATVELSLASPMFQELGSDAREGLEVVAFFPQGINEDNVYSLFPTISDGPNMFDRFCDLSLTHRSNGFITMFAHLRDYLHPKNPMASSLLLTVKEHYFRRLSAEVVPGKPGFYEAQWITLEDVNVEHLLDIFTSVDADSEGVWDACIDFVDHLRWHKPRLVVLESKFEALPENHPSKPDCLLSLSRLFHRVGNWRERKQLLIQSLGLCRGEGDDLWVTEISIHLDDASQEMGRVGEEGIQRAREASDIYGRFGRTGEQADSLIILALLLQEDEEFDGAEEEATRAMGLSEDQLQLCQCHRILGAIQHSKGNTEKAIHHLEESFRIASVINSCDELLESHLALADLYIEEDRLDDAHTHVEHVKSLSRDDDMFTLGCAFFHGARLSYRRNRPEEGESEALHAIAMFEGLGATRPVEHIRRCLEGPWK